MVLVVGLGNPGKAYQGTRHNAGFLAVEAFAELHGFPEFSLDKYSNSLLAECVIPGITQPVLLAKPQTFMNGSGKAVQSLFPRLSLGVPRLSLGKTQELVVVHDDIDLPLGEVRVSANRGSAGHKGVESVIAALGTKNFTRVRIGIQPKRGKPKDVEAFVLKKFARAELPVLQSAIQKAEGAIASLISIR